MVEQLHRAMPFHFSVSATTRPPRPGEKHGEDYFFLDASEFRRWINEGDFLEWAVYDHHLYGTPRRAVDEHLDKGEDVILDIEVQGARQIEASNPKAILVFIAPPSLDDLAERLRNRGDTDPGEIARRLEIASTEIAARDRFDHYVVNDELDGAVAELIGILSDVEPSERPPS